MGMIGLFDLDQKQANLMIRCFCCSSWRFELSMRVTAFPSDLRSCIGLTPLLCSSRWDKQVHNRHSAQLLAFHARAFSWSKSAPYFARSALLEEEIWFFLCFFLVIYLPLKDSSTYSSYLQSCIGLHSTVICAEYYTSKHGPSAVVVIFIISSRLSSDFFVLCLDWV